MQQRPDAFGHFDDNGMEYVITDPFAPPRAQVNFAWNDELISAVNQFGSGEGIFNDRTLMLNDPRGRVHLIRNGRRYFYLRDCETGVFWNTGCFPTRPEGARHTCHVGLGYSRFVTEYDGLRVESRMTVAPDEPVELWEFSVRETAGRRRSLWLCPYVEWDLGGYPTFSSKYSYFRSTFDRQRRAVLSLNTSNERPHPRYNAFVATDGEVVGWCGSPRQFFGPYGTPSRPEALVRGTMPCEEAWCEDLAGAPAIRVDVEPGSERTTAVALGVFDTQAEKDRLIDTVLPRAYRDEAFAALRREKQQMADTVRVETPDARLNVLTNIWLKQQTQLCVEFGRDGARGFRDTLQDAWAAAPFNPRLAREKLVETMRHQHADGHGIRGWMPLQPHHYMVGSLE